MSNTANQSTLYLIRELQLKKSKKIQDFFINMNKTLILLKECKTKETFFSILDEYLKNNFKITNFSINLINNKILKTHQTIDFNNKENNLNFDLILLNHILNINICLDDDNSLIITNNENEIYSFFDNISYILKEYLNIDEK